MNTLKKCIKHTTRAKRYEGLMNLHVAKARIYLAYCEEEEIGAFRDALDEMDTVVEVAFDDD